MNQENSPASNKRLAAYVAGSCALSLVAVLLAAYALSKASQPAETPSRTETPVVRQTQAPGPVPNPAEAESLQQEETEPPEGMKTYRNAEIGLSFSYPARYEVVEDEELAGFDRGQMRSVTVRDDQGSVFHAQATSPDYAMGISEGCCYTFTGSLDMTKGTDELQGIVENRLQNIFEPRMSTVGGLPSLEFFYPHAYVTTQIVKAYVTPIAHPTYANVFFTSDALSSMEGGYDENFEDIQTVFEGPSETYPELDQRKLKAFEDILASVQWE